MKVLNVGGGFSREIPKYFDGWEQVLLDIDPTVNPDICCDALEMDKLEPAQFDAVFCSHNLEHFYQHDVSKVLRGFHHVLKEDGFIEIQVPDIACLFQHIMQHGLDINDVWYRNEGQPITFHDVLYGWSKQMEVGNLYYAHKCAFTSLSLQTAISNAGFAYGAVGNLGTNLQGFGFKKEASEEIKKLLGLK